MLDDGDFTPLPPLAAEVVKLTRDWSLSDRGRRLDHIWVTPPLRGQLAAAEVHRAARGWELASDHVSVVLRLEG